VDAGFPELGALGPLPAGYVEARPVGTSVLLQVLKQHGPGLPREGDKASPEVVARAAHIEHVLAPLVDATLWLHAPCYAQHTAPAVRRGCSSLLPLPAWWFCSCRQRQVSLALAGDATKYRALAVRRAVRDFTAFLRANVEEFDRRHCALRQHSLPPELHDFTLFAYARVLLSVPPELAPWPAELEGLEGLRRFVSAMTKTIERPTKEALLGHAKPGVLGKLLDELVSDALDLGGDHDVGEVITNRVQSAPSGLSSSLFSGMAAAAARGGSVLRGLRSAGRAPAGSAGKTQSSAGPGSSAQGDSGASANAGDASPTAGPRSEKQAALRAARRRSNLMFLAWWVVSMGGFGAWTMWRNVQKFRAQQASAPRQK